MENFIREAQVAFRAKDFEKSFELYSKAIGAVESEEEGQWMSAEELAELYMLRGTSLLAMNEKEAYEEPDIFNQILDDFDHSIELDPNQMESYGLRGRLYLNCQFTTYFEEARKDFQEVLKSEPTHLPTLSAMGQLFYEMEEYDKSIYYLSLVLKEAPTVESWELRALANFRKIPPNYAQSARDFEEAKQLAPEREEYYLWKVQCFTELDLIDDAVKEYDQLIARNPNNSAYWIDRGSLIWDIYPEQALEDFSTAIELSDHPLAYNNRATYYRSQGELDKALADAQKGLAIDSEMGVIYATLAEIYADKREEDSFYEYLSLALTYYYEDIVDARSEPAFQPYASTPKFLAVLEASKNTRTNHTNTDES